MKKLLLYLCLGFLVFFGGAVLFYAASPWPLLRIQPKPLQPPQKVYDYYLIIHEQTGETLMYVPLVVAVGDEVITEQNQRFRIIRLEANRAIARYIENIDMSKYKSP